MNIKKPARDLFKVYNRVGDNKRKMDPESLAPEIAAEPETTVVTVDISDTLTDLDSQQTVVTLEDVSGDSQLEPTINYLSDIVSSFIQ